MTARSEQFRRFEYSTTTTMAAKQELRTELQRDIAAWEAAGNRIQEASPLVIKPRPPRKELPPPVGRASYRIRWTDAEIAMVRKLKAEGLSHRQVAARISEHFGIKRGRPAVESLCHLRSIPSVQIKKPRGTDIGARSRRKRKTSITTE